MATSGKSIRILFVDDDREFLEVLRDYFEGEGHQVITAPSAESALGFLKITKVDLIVSDMDMPRMNGVQLLQELQTLGSEVPFVFLSAQTAMTARRAAELGAAGYFEKPQRLDLMRSGLIKISEALQTKSP